jgi:hypothetical protein
MKVSVIINLLFFIFEVYTRSCSLYFLYTINQLQALHREQPGGFAHVIMAEYRYLAKPHHEWLDV